MAPEQERPAQGKFSKEETNFLKTHLLAYEALCNQLGEQATGPRGTGLVKGQKKDWILAKVFPEFVKEFSSDQNGGPQLQSLQTKLSRWFANHASHRNFGPGLTTAASPKRPRATNGVNVFADDHKAKIAERMAEKQDQEGGAPMQVNLTRYRKIKQELYDELTSDEHRAYEAKAAEKNEARKSLPEKSKIFENQGNIVSEVVKAVHNLIGWDWGQCGEAVFFVQGAYRNADNDLKVFNVSVGSSMKITSFPSTIPDYKKVLRGPFREWAENALPVPLPTSEGAVNIAVDQKCGIYLQEDGFPRLPAFDINIVAPNDARFMLKAYIEFTWESAIKKVQGSDLGAVPWDLLGTTSLRRKLLVNPEAFSHVKTLDPMLMSPHDVYTVLALLLKGQDSGVRALEFSIGDLFNSDPLTATPRDVGLDNTTAEMDNYIIERLGSAENESSTAPPLPLVSVSFPAITASPVIDTPPKSIPPVSESMVKVAIEKVAEAGYLNLSNATAINAPNQKTHGTAETSNSNTTKRRQVETEEGSPNEEKPTKKSRKAAVPIREQSSRLKDSSYKNKYVAVRPR